MPKMICDDCGHEHGGAPFGFCKCHCTYPGWHFEWELNIPIFIRIH